MYTLKTFFISFVAPVKSYHGPSIWKKLTHKSLSVYVVSGDTISKWEMFVWILSHVPTAIATSIHSKIIKLGQNEWRIFPRSLMWWCQIIDCLQFESHPCPLRNFWVAKNTSFRFLIVLCTLRFTHMQSLTA